MKPLKLEFEGINSFSEHTIIDFEVLTKNGLFGIFGDTGSGKSTILDCINFALYGDVERSKEKTDIINYRCETARVKFSFNILAEGKRKVYTVERIIKKDKYGTHKAVLYEDGGEGEVCIADKSSQVEKKITDILGVDAEDFRKCIALPQGEFSRFVKAAPRDRLSLIERLFNLSKYGDRLKEKLTVLQNESENEYQNIAGRLLAYEEITKERLEEAEARLNQEKLLFSALEESHKIAEDKFDRLKLLNLKRIELDSALSELQEMAGREREMNDLRESLSVLALCREAVKINSELTSKIVEKQKFAKSITALNEQCEQERKISAELEEQIKRNDYDAQIDNCLRMAASFAACTGKEEKLKSILSELENKRAEYHSLDLERQKLDKLAKEAEAAVSEAERDLAKYKDNDIAHLINVCFKGAVLKDEYVTNYDYFINLRNGIKVYKDDTPFYKYVESEIKEKVAEYRQRIDDIGSVGFEHADEQLKKILAMDAQRSNKQKTLSDCKERAHKLKADLELICGNLKNILKAGADLRERADELRNDLKAAFGDECSDFGRARADNELRLSTLKSEKQNLQSRLELSKTTSNELALSAERMKTLLFAAENESAGLESKLNALIKESGFDSLEKCVSLADKFEKFPSAEEKLAEYDMRKNAVREKITELSGIKDIASFKPEMLVAAEQEKISVMEKLSQVTGNIAVAEAQIFDISSKLTEKNQILKEFDCIIKQRDRIFALKEITKGNKFLEYIANEYLCDIASLASVTLLKLQDGRYFLTYKDNNFYVGDNYDCGNLRGVNTLSGGEIFLVSLSLALALSQTICARSMKSIEFFFLDEGFGTLDSSLVDIVIGALEKLKSSDFTIGIISHVEELKHRIESKITVNKATEDRGSAVKVSC